MKEETKRNTINGIQMGMDNEPYPKAFFTKTKT